MRDPGRIRSDARGGWVDVHPIVTYFILTFAISWACALAVAAPCLLAREPLTRVTGILMFPAMLLGPSTSGIFLTWFSGGHGSLRDLFLQMRRWRFSWYWYAPLLVPPVLMLAVLLSLKTFVSPVYSPNRFLIGIFFGVPAGLLEEIGWTGYAYPRMRCQMNGFVAGVVLGLLWGLWHLPVIDFLGTATPHRSYWFSFILAFTAAMTAMRILICWMYTHTKSVLLAQLMHVSSTGSLVVFSPARVTPAQEVFWYAFYAVALWLLAAFVGKDMRKPIVHK